MKEEEEDKIDAEAQQSSCSAGTSAGAPVKKGPKIGLIQARADVDASARAERELLQFREFAGIQMRTADGGLVTELTDDANTNPLDWCDMVEEMGIQVS